AGMLDFMRLVYHKYAFRILRVADFQRELEAYTGRSWEEFFQNWLYSPGMCDWCLEEARVEPLAGGTPRLGRRIAALLAVACFDTSPERQRRDGPVAGAPGLCRSGPRWQPCKVTVLLRQKGQCTEPTVLGFRLQDGDGYQVRVPIVPAAGAVLLDDGAVRV